MRRIVRNLLKESGFADADEAEDGVAALNKLRNSKFDFVVTDINMPNMNGLEFLAQVPAERFRADLPVIIITGFSTESSAIEAVNLGVAGYLTKPFRVPQVLAAAAKALGE